MIKNNNIIAYIAAIIVLCILFSQTVIANEAKYEDLPESHWAYNYITEMTREGILTGYPDGSFRPDDQVTYGEFIKMVTLATNVMGHDKKSTYHWATPYYEAGLNMGYYTSYDINKKVLDQPIQRGYMALILSRAAALEIPENVDYGAVLNQIQDVDSRTPYEYEIVSAYASGMLKGYPDGSFRPAGFLTRAETAVALFQLMEQNSYADETLPKQPEGTYVKEGSVLTSEPEGTVTLTMQPYIHGQEAQQQELMKLLKNHVPDHAEEIYRALIEFAAKQAGPGGQGIRKQYFGSLPVLMERINETVRIFIFPEGYTSRTWNTKPGQISEEFF